LDFFGVTLSLFFVLKFLVFLLLTLRYPPLGPFVFFFPDPLSSRLVLSRLIPPPRAGLVVAPQPVDLPHPALPSVVLHDALGGFLLCLPNFFWSSVPVPCFTPRPSSVFAAFSPLFLLKADYTLPPIAFHKTTCPSLFMFRLCPLSV